MTEQITGGCKCGRCRYEGERAEAEMFRCYCRDCQQLTGTGHAEMLPLVAGSFVLHGPVREFEMAGGSGRPTWSVFCGSCGAPLMRRSQRMSDRVYVHAASLDDPALYRPERVIYAEAAQDWDAPPG